MSAVWRAVVAYVLPATPLGITALLSSSMTAPLAGDVLARLWWVPVAFGYAAWDFFSSYQQWRGEQARASDSPPH